MEMRRRLFWPRVAFATALLLLLVPSGASRHVGFGPQLLVNLCTVIIVVPDHLVQRLRRQLRVVAENALPIAALTPVEGDSAHRHSRAADDRGAALDGGVSGNVRVAVRADR